MGYYTRVTGEITIDPPLTATELRDLVPEFVGNRAWREGNKTVQINVAERMEEIPDGKIVQEIGTAIIPISEDDYKAYTIQEDLQELCNILTLTADQEAVVHGGAITLRVRSFSGWLYGKGERGDHWRATIGPSGAIYEEAKLLWPDGTTADVEI